MAKKKHTSKKHTFKHAASSATVVPAVEVTGAPAAGPAGQTPMAASLVTTDGRDFSYVRRDLRRLAMFSTILIGIEIVIWLVVEHTSFGSGIFDLIKL